MHITWPSPLPKRVHSGRGLRVWWVTDLSLRRDNLDSGHLLLVRFVYNTAASSCKHRCLTLPLPYR